MSTPVADGMPDTTRRAIERKHAALRVERFLDARARMPQLDPETIAGVHSGPEGFTSLTPADLRTLVRAVLEDS